MYARDKVLLKPSIPKHITKQRSTQVVGFCYALNYLHLQIPLGHAMLTLSPKVDKVIILSYIIYSKVSIVNGRLLLFWPMINLGLI